MKNKYPVWKDPMNGTWITFYIAHKDKPEVGRVRGQVESLGVVLEMIINYQTGTLNNLRSEGEFIIYK